MWPIYEVCIFIKEIKGAFHFYDSSLCPRCWKSAVTTSTRGGGGDVCFTHRHSADVFFVCLFVRLFYTLACFFCFCFLIKLCLLCRGTCLNSHNRGAWLTCNLCLVPARTETANSPPPTHTHTHTKINDTVIGEREREREREREEAVSGDRGGGGGGGGRRRKAPGPLVLAAPLLSQSNPTTSRVPPECPGLWTYFFSPRESGTGHLQKNKINK